MVIEDAFLEAVRVKLAAGGQFWLEKAWHISNQPPPIWWWTGTNHLHKMCTATLENTFLPTYITSCLRWWHSIQCDQPSVKKSTAFLAYVFSPDGSSDGVDHMSPRRKGTVKASFRFKEPLPNSVFIIVLVQFDKTVVIDKNHIWLHSLTTTPSAWKGPI